MLFELWGITKYDRTLHRARLWFEAHLYMRTFAQKIRLKKPYPCLYLYLCLYEQTYSTLYASSSWLLGLHAKLR